MKRKIAFLVALIIGVGVANAAVRDEKTVTRNTPTTNTVRTVSRSATTKNITSRNPKSQTLNRNSVASRTNRNPQTKNTSARTAKNSIIRTIQPQTRNSNQRNTVTKNILSNARSAKSIVSRASSAPMDAAEHMGTGYTTCRDSYFTCMDQFCSIANDTYRRCYCSSRLTEIQSRERALSQAANQLEDFKALNLEVIDKSSDEVKSMVSATEGEQAKEHAKDKSNAAQQLSGISAVLSKTKKESLNNQGTLDIAGDINAIWSTTDLAGGTNISNLSGEPLYNAVHAQCSELVADSCADPATKTMVVTAYGMYIENDCSMLINTLDKKLVAANATIRDTEYVMGDLRLENYDAHNSASIHECIAQVRQDITANTACGTDYVHCLDVTGRYLNYETGEPIYTSNFFQLDTQTSLSGDLLTNQTNRLLVDRLNKMREYAKRGLDTCRDIADSVWDEFLRQAVTEIHQGQQAKIRQVKDECLDVVNKCYDEQNQSLKDFSNTDEALLLGSRLELSEEMCREKMDTCSNLYGGGTKGLEELLTAMGDIIEQKIAQQCLSALENYTKELCAVSGTDTLHTYPYGCRVYTPGSQEYVSNPDCNKIKAKGHIITKKNKKYSTESCTKDYTSCNEGYYHVSGKKTAERQGQQTYSLRAANIMPEKLPGWNVSQTITQGLYGQCIKCPDNVYCPAGTEQNQLNDLSALTCSTDYAGSLYYKLANYAMDVCIRPSKRDVSLPHTVLQDINVVMDQIRSGISKELARECERLGGTWVSTAYEEGVTKDTLLSEFEKETSANKNWGYCKE